MRISLDHAHIFASDLSATVGFFQRMFGAVVVWDEEAAGVRNVRLAVGHGFLHVYDQPPRTARGGVVHHLGIETENLEELMAHMKANGASIPNPIREHAKFKYAMVAAPDSLLIELFQCHEPARWRIPTQPSTSTLNPT